MEKRYKEYQHHFPAVLKGVEVETSESKRWIISENQSTSVFVHISRVSYG